MTESVIEINDNTVGDFNSYTAQLKSKAIEFVPSREIIFLGTTLILLQILDGFLTGIGMYHFGTDHEANPLLQKLMSEYGYINALIMAKSLAILIVCALCALSNFVDWLTVALKIVIGVYLGAAVLPWTFILLSRIVFLA